MFKKLKSLFKKKSIVGEQPDTTIKENQLDFPIDRSDYFFDHALVFYCEENNIPSEKLSQSDMLKITWISVIQSWLMMLLELNLTGKSITWLKMILTRCSANIKLTSDNIKNASLNREKHFLISKILPLMLRPKLTNKQGLLLHR